MLEPIGIVARFEDLAVMGEAVEQGSGHLGIPEHPHPFAEAEIGRDDERGLLVKLGSPGETARHSRSRRTADNLGRVHKI